VNWLPGKVSFLLAKSQKNKQDFNLLREAAATSRLIPATMMSWPNGLPPARWRLPIDDELTLLTRRKRSPVVRGDSVIQAEFPALNWDGPYRAARFVLFEFFVLRLPENAAYRRVWIIKEAEAHLGLICDIQKSVCAYVDAIDGSFHKPDYLSPGPRRLPGSRQSEFFKNFAQLQVMGITVVEILERITREFLRNNKKGGRPPALWKSDFVTALANLWRIMTGEDASKDLTSPFASFVAAAWNSLGEELPEISWGSQIARRKHTWLAADLASWANFIREQSLKHPLLERNPDRTQPKN
jgi:hypothetical protein